VTRLVPGAATAGLRVELDPDGGASLDGVWELFPGDHAIGDLDRLAPTPIRVPGLWEAQGHLELDGVAWYRRRFLLDEVAGYWTLRFGAVMDLAEVFLNGRLLGGHEVPFTPFELDPTGALAAGENTLAVRVTDPPVGDPEHLRLPHGKQGWGNRAFPSPPSLYLTYGGIWQPVRLRRHGPVAVRDVFVNGDPDDLVVTVEVEEVAGGSRPAQVTLRTLGRRTRTTVALEARGRARVRLPLGATAAARWSPERPALHEALVEVTAAGEPSDRRVVRYGLRTVRVEGARLLVDGMPYRMRSALVQGFWPDGLYAEEGDRAIRAEVAAAKAMGLNTLRLHVKGFDPAYLDACDELGMFLHCDLPVVEPVEHAELHADGVLTRRCRTAAREQVRRDRSHPSVLLWSAMNEVGLERHPEVRASAGYEAFARALVATIREADPTRPVIENDWVEPDPARVFATPLLTAHWYGRLHTDYLEALERRAARWAGTGRPLFVTEFGDWGLPAPPAGRSAGFWDPGPAHVAELAATPWPGSPAEFAEGTQRYQGLSDRLQAEVFRRHDHLGGWCVTELTDVPHELNGLLDLERRPKRAAVDELTRASQPVLPMLALTAFTWAAGSRLRAPLHVANDGPELHRVRIGLRLGRAAVTIDVGELPAHRSTALGEVELPLPDRPGDEPLRLELTAGGRPVARNRYPVHVVGRPEAPFAVQLAGGGATASALARLGVRVDPVHRAPGSGPLVVAEGGLDQAAAARVRDLLDGGGTALVLAQAADAAGRYPVPAAIAPVQTAWGPSVFHFTTDHAGLPSLPRRTVLTTQALTVEPAGVLTRLGEHGWPAETIVGAYKPAPDPVRGTVVGACPVGAGRLLACQFRLTERAAAGDPAASALLAELVRLAADATTP
jgi:Glycosyl hydrolases family 2, TIM barrel domain/Glycosyl hydrolases family 2, sugar binding domain/Glycosyl hydrolases family 2